MAQKLIYGFSTRDDGNMSLNWGEENEVIGNRKRWLEKQNIIFKDCVFMSLPSGIDVNEVKENDKGKTIVGDGLITRDKKTALFMVTGDCLPVIMYEDNTVALAHLGWRGVRGKLAQKVAKYFTNPKVIIGPGVRKESYIKFGEKLDFFFKEIAETREEWEPFLIKMPDRDNWYQVDLVGYVTKQLKDVGVGQENIIVNPIDTIKDENYFSHYRVGLKEVPTEKEGRFATVVIMK